MDQLKTWILHLIRETDSVPVKVVLVVIFLLLFLLTTLWTLMGIFGAAVLVADLQKKETTAATLAAALIKNLPPPAWPWFVSAILAVAFSATLIWIASQVFRRRPPAPVVSPTQPRFMRIAQQASSPFSAYTPSPDRIAVRISLPNNELPDKAEVIAVSQVGAHSSDKTITDDRGLAELTSVSADRTYTVLVARADSEGSITPGITVGGPVRPISLPISEAFASTIFTNARGTIDGLDTHFQTGYMNDGTPYLYSLDPPAAINGRAADGRAYPFHRDQDLTIEDRLSRKLRVRFRFLEGQTSLVRVFWLAADTRTSERAERLLAALSKRGSLQVKARNLSAAIRDGLLAYHGSIDEVAEVDKNMHDPFITVLLDMTERLEKRLKCPHLAVRDRLSGTVIGWALIADDLEDAAAGLGP